MENLEMIQMLEQLRQDINADIERRKYAYIGKDGKDYYDKKTLDAANKAYIEIMYTYIGKDGRNYNTSEGLFEANKIYNNTMLSYIEPVSKETACYDDLDISHKIR